MPEHELFTGRAVHSRGASAIGCYRQYVISVTLAGTVTYDCDCRPFEVTAGDVAIVYPNTAQHWQVRTDVKWDTIYCIFTARAHWLPWLRMTQQPPGYVRLRIPDAYVYRQIVACFSELLRSSRKATAHQLDFDLNLVERLLLWCRTIQAAQTQPMDDRVRAALDHIAANLDQPLSLELLAAAADASRSRLASLFRQQVGETPMAYVERQRLTRAMQMLRYSTDPIAIIAQRVGFDDPRYFANRFHRHTGRSPRDYRRSAEKK